MSATHLACQSATHLAHESENVSATHLACQSATHLAHESEKGSATHLACQSATHLAHESENVSATHLACQSVPSTQFDLTPQMAEESVVAKAHSELLQYLRTIQHCIRGSCWIVSTIQILSRLRMWLRARRLSPKLNNCFPDSDGLVLSLLTVLVLSQPID